jgi:putative ABC transport system permease protein
MFLKILGKSLAKRKSRVIIATLAVIMSASIASTLFSISTTIEAKIGEELRKFGANIIVLPRSDTIEVGLPGINFGSVTEQRYINETDLWKIKNITNWNANVLGYAPFLYQVVSISRNNKTRDVVLSGTYFRRGTSSPGGTFRVVGSRTRRTWPVA